MTTELLLFLRRLEDEDEDEDGLVSTMLPTGFNGSLRALKRNREVNHKHRRSFIPLSTFLLWLSGKSPQKPVFPDISYHVPLHPNISLAIPAMNIVRSIAQKVRPALPF